MKVRIERLIKHLKTQIALSVEDSDWVYITKNEAKKCLELAEAGTEKHEVFCSFATISTEVYSGQV